MTFSLGIKTKNRLVGLSDTQISANDVDFPINKVVWKNGEYYSKEWRFEQIELEYISTFWNYRLKNAIVELPSEMLTSSFEGEKTILENS